MKNNLMRTSKIIKISIVAFGFLGLIVITVLLFYYGILQFNYPSKNKFPVRGIDISHHQGEINWAELKTENIKFVFIKATEGGDFKDQKFQDNWSNAKKDNYHVGAYHFYRVCKNGEEQASNFIQVVPKNADNLPPVVDLEFVGNYNTNKTKEQIQLEILNCLNILENYYEQIPILYVTEEFYKEYINNKFSKYPIWFRSIYHKPKLSEIKEWTFWQYSNRAHLKGIDGHVDLNVFNGHIQELIKLKK